MQGSFSADLLCGRTVSRRDVRAHYNATIGKMGTDTIPGFAREARYSGNSTGASLKDGGQVCPRNRSIEEGEAFAETVRRSTRSRLEQRLRELRTGAIDS